MKHLLLCLALTFISLQFSKAEDLSLSLNDAVAEWSLSTINSTEGIITLIGNYEPVGWIFATPISKAEYTGLKVTFKETVSHSFLEIKIKYAGQENAVYTPISVGSTSSIISFTNDVESIQFQSSRWDGAFPTEPPYPFLSIASVVLTAPITTTKEPLSLSNAIADWGQSLIDATEGTITLKNNYEGVGWTFDPVKSNDTYLGAVVGLSEAIAFDHLEMVVTYEGAGSPSYNSIPKGSLSAQVNFTGPVVSVKFQSSNWQSALTEPFPVVHFEEIYLLKKGDDTGTITNKINEDSGLTDVYTIMGIKIRSQVEKANAANGLQNGIYIIDGKKICVVNQ